MATLLLEGFTPPAEYPPDADLWTQARIERALAPDPAVPTIARAAFNLSPAITVPADPPTYNFSVDSPAGEGDWWRVVWLDAGGIESPTDWQPFRAQSPYAPTVGEVAMRIRAHVVEYGGERVVNFTDSTEPSASQVAGMIAAHAPLVLMRVGDLGDLACPQATVLQDAVRTVIAERVAIDIELSFRSEQVGTDASLATEQRISRLDSDLLAVIERIDACRAEGSEGDSSSANDPAYSFPVVPYLNWR